ncbi:hypothetical protein HQ585_04830 [candidate division KSB1 bacterium]|nr:hypothetical protein [candidate division KSB1 bacterium]
MIGYLILAFLTGGLFGMMGMAALAYGSKSNLMRELYLLKKRLNFIEDEAPQKRTYKAVKDPRPQVQSLIN